jgi:hypothetical protein
MSIFQDFLLGQQNRKDVDGYFLVTIREDSSLITSLYFHTDATLIVSASTLDHGFCFLSLLLSFFYSCPGSGFNGFS